MIRLWLGLTLAITALGGCKTDAPPTSAGAPVALPAAPDLVAKSVAAMGGEAALRAHTSSLSTGTLSMPKQGMSGPITIVQRAPSDFYSRCDIPGIGLMEEGVTGGVAWSSDPLSGPRIKEGVEATQALRQADFYFSLNLAQHYPTMQTLGASTLDGAPVWEVLMKPAEGPDEIYLIDQQSGLLVGTRTSLVTLMGTVPANTRFLDYREVGGVLIPHKIVVSNALISSEITYDSVQWDVPDPGIPGVPAELTTP